MRDVDDLAAIGLIGFQAGFDFKEVLHSVVIDLSRAHFWDITAVGAVDKVVLKFRREGTRVELLGMNEASATLLDRYGETDPADTTEAWLPKGDKP